MHGIRVMSTSVSLALNPIIDNSKWANPYWKPSNLAQTSDGPNYKKAQVFKPQCGTMISMEDWMSANADLIAQKRAELHKKIQAVKARQRERNMRKKILDELEQFNEDTWQPAAGSCERASPAIDTDHKNTREMRNRTHVVRCSGTLIQEIETFTDIFTGKEVEYTTSKRVGELSFYRHHDSHGQHGRKPRYKDVPRGDEPQHSPHFRVKHTRNLNGDLITA